MKLGVLPPYDIHIQSWWMEQARNAKHDMWFRIMALAFACHRRNGHASFGAGEIARELKVTERKVSDGIRDAKRWGVIDEQSCSRCLVVPAHGILGGLGHENDACAWHDGKRTGRRNTRQIRSGAYRHPVSPDTLTDASPVDLDAFTTPSSAVPALT